MSRTIEVSTTLVTISCKCGGVYAITEQHYDQCRKVGSSWTCPYCETGWGFAGNSENARLKRELEEQKLEAERARENARWHAGVAERNRERANQTERRLSATKGVVTRMKNRAAAGVCPCCTRTFQNLAQHMKSQHPGYGKADDDE